VKSVRVPVGMDVVVAASVVFLVDFAVVVDVVGPQSDVNDNDASIIRVIRCHSRLDMIEIDGFIGYRYTFLDSGRR